MWLDIWHFPLLRTYPNIIHTIFGVIKMKDESKRKGPTASQTPGFLWVAGAGLSYNPHYREIPSRLTTPAGVMAQ